MVNRLAVVAVIALGAAAASHYSVTPQDTWNTMFGLSKTPLRLEEAQTVTARLATKAGAAIGSEWFRPSHCHFGNGQMVLNVGPNKLSISPHDVDQMEVSWLDTWNQKPDQQVSLHRTSACADRPLPVVNLRIRSQGSFRDGMMIWKTTESDRSVATYVAKVVDLRDNGRCYNDNRLRICKDPEAKDAPGEATIYIFIDDLEKKLGSGAPWNLHCHATLGEFDENRKTPLRDVNCQMADISNKTYSYMAHLRYKNVIPVEVFYDLHTEMNARLDGYRG